MKYFTALLALVTACGTGVLAAQETAPRKSANQGGATSARSQPRDAAADEAAIQQSVAEYVQAFNARNAAALAEKWTAGAVYIDRGTGEQVVGRAAIAGQFTELFKAQPELKLAVSVESIRFLSPSVAIEEGTARFWLPKGEPDEVEYTAVHVKHDDRWLLDRVTDAAKVSAPSHHEQLKSLDWMVGGWIDDAEGATIETQCNWSKNQNFLIRSFKVAVGDRIEMAGMQVVGWDPSAKTIRSWTFDSDGGFAEATWTQKKDRWFVRNIGVLADGQKASMLNVIKPIDADSFTWQTIERTVGGELLPNIDEVTIRRQ
jgi:uncharacterized protein (TIGR02246 family)